MMMMGEPGNLSISVPPWPYNPSSVSPTGEPQSPYSLEEVTLAAAAFGHYLPSANDPYDDSEESDLLDPPVDTFSCDEFRMYEFKIRRCARGRSHDWTECPFAHPGEKARRRDPRKYHYSGTACPDFRKGQCKRGDACEFAHGVFECWLHPARYRTQPCKDGTSCRRRVCFFAHTPEQLRVLPQEKSPRGGNAVGTGFVPESYDGSPLRRQHAIDLYVSNCLMSSSPTSTLMSPPKSPPSESPPMSPVDSTGCTTVRRSCTSYPVGSPVNDVLASLRQLRLGNVKSIPSSWAVQMGNSAGYGSPKAGTGTMSGTTGFRSGFCSLPSTPTRSGTGMSGTGMSGTGMSGTGMSGTGMSGTGMSGTGMSGTMNGDLGLIEEEPTERVESGRALREKVFQRLSLDECVPNTQSPYVDWVSDLIN